MKITAIFLGSIAFLTMATSNINFSLKQKTALPILYGFFFALSIILINPWGDSIAEIWVEPKLLIIQIIVVLNLWVIFGHLQKRSLIISSVWKVGTSLWLLFLCIGVISTLLSPSPLRSFYGHIDLGDGLLYWSFVATFVVSNALVINLKSKIIRYQLYGLLFGGVVLAFAVFLQVYDWRIDFTVTSGLIDISNPQMLLSRIWKPMMPIGFYTNRGEAAFPLALEGILSLLGLVWGWISLPIAGVIYLLTSTALFYTKCRGALLALLVASIYLLVRFPSNSTKRVKIIAYGLGVLIVSYLIFKISPMLLTPEFTSRSTPRNFKLDLGNLDSSLGRLQHWKFSLQGIAERPWFGWGFDGLGTAFPYIADFTGEHKQYLFSRTPVDKILDVKSYTFFYLGIDGLVHQGLIMLNKAHNLIVDTAISVGILGLISYLSMFAFFIWCAFNSTFLGIEATAIAYLVYTMTWYESGQFSHLGWWGLSVGLGCTKLFQSKK